MKKSQNRSITSEHNEKSVQKTCQRINYNEQNREKYARNQYESYHNVDVQYKYSFILANFIEKQILNGINEGKKWTGKVAICFTTSFEAAYKRRL